MNELIKKLNKKKWMHKRELYEPVFEKVQYFNKVEKPDISIIIISWRFHPDTLENLKILSKQRKENFELIFVNNGAPDKEYEVLYPFIDTYIKLNQNTGCPFGRNIGALFAESPQIMFLDDDAIPDDDLIKLHIEMINSGNYNSIRGSCLPLNNVKENLNVFHYYQGSKFFYSYNNLEGNSSYNSFIFFHIGGWDDKIFFGGEGKELAFRIFKYDSDMSKQIYCPYAIIFHDYATSEEHLSIKKERGKKSLERLRSLYPEWDSWDKEWEKFNLNNKNRMEFHKKELFENVFRRNQNKINDFLDKSFLNLNWYMIDYSIQRIIKNKKDRNLCIYGAGVNGINLSLILKNQLLEVDFFIDSDKTKKGNIIEKIPIIAADEISKNKNYIIIASKWYNEIQEYLIEKGFEYNNDFLIY